MARHPLRHQALATLIALILVVIVPHELTRYILALAWFTQCGWFALATYAKKPPLTSQQRQQMMAYHIDRGLELARDDGERAMLLAWVSTKLDSDTTR